MSADGPVGPDESLLAGRGIADVHGLIAIVGGVTLLAASCVCCFDPIRDDYAIYGVGWLGVAGFWSALFGISTPGSILGRGLAWLGLASVVTALVVVCFGGVFGRY